MSMMLRDETPIVVGVGEWTNKTELVDPLSLCEKTSKIALDDTQASDV